MRSTLPAAVLVLAIVPFLTAPRLRAQEHDHSDAPLVLGVEMSDFAYAPEVLRLPAGRPINLVFRNSGSVAHEFMAGRASANGDFETDLFAGLEVEMETGHAREEHAEAKEHDHAEAMEHDHAEAMGHHHGRADHGTMVLVEPGESGRMTFELPSNLKGEWEMACFIPGHYERGMHGTVIVY